MNVRILGIHGIHSKEGDNNMGRFMSAIARALPPGADADIFEYGFMGFWEARWHNARVAEQLAATAVEKKSPDKLEVWVTHSNGAAIAYMACKDKGANPDLIVNINPALDRWRVAPVWAVETICSPEDRWVHMARWLPGHIWGDQGKVGIRDAWNRKIERPGITHRAQTFGAPMAYADHCGAFANIRRERWAHFVIDRVSSYHDMWRQQHAII
jgi:hypothetical protein